MVLFFRRIKILPILERDRLHSRTPLETSSRHFAAWLADIQTKRIVPFVRCNPFCVFRGRIRCQADLGEHGIAVQKKFHRNLRGFIAQPAGAGNIGEDIRRGDDFFRFSGTGDAVVFLIGDIPVNPAVTHAKLLHDSSQIGGIVRTIGARLHFHRVVGPGSGVFKIPDVMPQGSEAECILNVIPCDASEGILPDQPGDDNPHLS